jgi:hypothetical protein
MAKMTSCKYPGCPRNTWPGAQYCLAHVAVSYMEGRAKRAAKSDPVKQVAWTAAAQIFNEPGLQDAITDAFVSLQQRGAAAAAQQLNNARARRAYKQQQQQQQQQPRQLDPQAQKLRDAYVALGLDPRTATVQQVEERRRQFARAFHTDAAGGSNEDMARINAAADLVRAALSRKAS